MKFTILAASLLGLAAAAPAPAPLENTNSLQARSLQATTHHTEVDKRALGWFGAAVVGGVVGPAVARFAGKFLGPEVPARKRSVTAEWGGLSWDDFRRKFLAGVVEDIYNADENRDADAAVCTGVGYSVSSPARTADSYAFGVEWKGERQERVSSVFC